MEILVWGIIFIMEVMKYVLGEEICFDGEIKRKKVFCISFVLYVFSMYILQIYISEIHYLLMYVFAIVTVSIMIWKNKKTTIIQVLLLIMGITSLDGVIENLLEYIFLENELWGSFPKYKVLLSSVIGVIILMGLNILKYCVKRNKSEKKRISIEYIWIIVIGMLANVLLTAAGLYAVKGEIHNERLKNFICVTNIYSYIAVILIVLFMIYIRNTNQRLQQAIKLERQLKKAQEQYYHSLLQKEEDTRKSRHDWNNHLICMAGLAKKENAQETERYIGTLINQIRNIQGKQYDVGNDIINAILNYYLMENGKGILIKVEGRFRKKIQMDAVDLCVIISNMIQNAVEYIESHNELKNQLSIIIEEGDLYQRIIIENVIDTKVSEKSIEKTSKEDKINHGMGISNAKEAIRRNDGKLQISVYDGKFRVEIIFKC